MKFRFGRIPKHYQFEYTPRFYDPEEEKRKAREVAYGDGDGDDAEKLKAQIRSGLARRGGSQFAYRSQRNAESKRSNRRLGLVLLTLALLAYLLLNSTRLERLLAVLSGG